MKSYFNFFFKKKNQDSKIEEDLYNIKTNGENNVLINVLQKAVEPIILFDVGANKGDYVNMILELSKLYNKKVEIHVFEPQKFNYELLKLKFSTQKNIFINNIALSNKAEYLPIYIESQGSPLASLYNRRCFQTPHYKLEKQIIQTTTAEMYIDYNNLKKIDLIKIDVEGHELSVIDGLGKYLQNSSCLINHIQFEYGGTYLDANIKLKDIFNRLSERYNIGKIFSENVFYSEYTENLEDFQYANYIAVLKK